MKFFLKIGITLFACFLFGFYFGNFNIGYINVRAKMRSMCECKVLVQAEKEYYKLKKLFKDRYKKIDTHGIGEK